MSLVTALFAAPALAVAAPAQEPIRYTLSPVIEHGAVTALAVRVDFRADPTGVTRLTFASRWAGEPRLGQWQSGLQVAGAQSVVAGDNGSAEIRSRPGARLRASYRIRSAYDSPPTTVNTEEARPIILPAWFYAPGEVLFAYPQDRDDAPAVFDWTGPRGFGFASDLEHLAGQRHPARRPGTVSDVLESIVIGGPSLQIVEGRGPNAGVRIAALGPFERFDLPAFAAQAFRTIRAERAFWGEQGEPFLVTLAPLVVQPGIDAYAGIGRTDAFALRVGADLPLEDLRALLAHEYFHTWNGKQLGDFGGDNHAAWLTEGFTDFYTRRLLLKAGIFDLDGYISAWNQALLAYGVSPARNAPQARITREFWTDPDVGDLPYKRGAMLAALFDADLRRQSGGARSLDDVVRRMRSLHAAQPDTPIEDVFARAFTELAGHSPAEQVDRFELNGETLKLPPQTFACLQLADVTQPVWNLGYDPEATAAAGGVFAGVDPNGPAYAAGLRDGMRRLLREGGAQNDSSVELVLHVADPDGRRHDIRYRPEGKSAVTFQRLLRPQHLSESQAAACAATLAGG